MVAKQFTHKLQISREIYFHAIRIQVLVGSRYEIDLFVRVAALQVKVGIVDKSKGSGKNQQKKI